MAGSLSALGGLAGFMDTMLTTGLSIENRLRTEHREDNAVQRRVKDLQAAGLNPLLAAGSAASSTSNPIGIGNGLSGVLNNMLAGKQADLLDSNIDKTEAETQKFLADAEAQRITNRYLDRQFNADIGLKEWNLRFEQAMSEPRIQQAWQDLTNSQREQISIELDNKIKELGITGVQLENEGRRLENQLKSKGIEGAELENQVKANVVFQSQVDSVIKELDLNQYEIDKLKNVSLWDLPGFLFGSVGDLLLNLKGDKSVLRQKIKDYIEKHIRRKN